MLLLGVRDDLREAFRRIRRNPRTSLVAVGTLALGIGSATAIFTIAYSFLMAPAPFRAPDRIVEIHGPRNSWGWQGVSGEDFVDYLKEPGLFESGTLTGYAEFSWTGQSLPGFDGAEVLRGYVVTADYFRVMDQAMAIGRGFMPGEDHTVVISHALWQRRFGGRDDIIGQSVTLNGTPHTVVGVAGRGFVTYEHYNVAAWVPIAPATQWRSSRQYSSYARLSPGLSLEQAQQRLDVLNRRLAEAYPATNAKYSAQIEPFLREARKEARPAMLALMGAVLPAPNRCVKCCEPAAGARGGSGARDGYPSRARRKPCTALSDGDCGELSAGAHGEYWRGGAGGMADDCAPRADPGHARDRLGLCPGRTSVRRRIPALCSRRSDCWCGASVRELSHGCRRYHTGYFGQSATTCDYNCRNRHGSRAGNRGRTSREEFPATPGPSSRLSHGFAIRHARASCWQSLPEHRSTCRLLGRVDRADPSLPGVAKSASVSDLPLGWQYSGGSFDVADKPVAPGMTKPRAHQIVASPGYFATLGIPLLAGRGFNEGDGPQSEPVAIVNDLLAQNIWPGENPIGKQINAWDGKSWRRVVGVVHRVRHGGPADQYENQLYIPYRQGNSNVMFLVVRARVPPEFIAAAIRATLKSMDPDMPAFEVRSMKAAFERETALPRLPMMLTAGFAGLAALLAALGLFGVIAYWVSRCTKELGIRAAIGARPAELRALVLRQGLRMAAIGITAGVAASLTVMRYLGSLMYGMSERDPWIYSGAIVLALGTAIIACWLPASQAARVDPAQALREEG